MTAEARSGMTDAAGVLRLIDALGPGGAPLRPSLERLDWVAVLPNAAAPGFVYLAGARRGSPVGGGGRDLAEAAGKLAGETAEALAEECQPPVVDDLAGNAAIDAIFTDLAECSRVTARNLGTGRPCGVPAAAIFASSSLAEKRRADAPPRSLGRAAGPDHGKAITAGLMELVERDAAAAWWLEGVRPSLADPGDIAVAAADLARLRTGAEMPRATSLLRLSSRTGLPVICALSRDPDGRGLALGLKAAPTPGAAARGAVLEVLQMEIALQIARHRAARGTATPGDAGVLARAALDPDTLPAFAFRPALPETTPSIDGLPGLLVHLEQQGITVTACDLATPPGTLAVAKVFAPALRPMPGGPGAARPDTPGARAPML